MLRVLITGITGFAGCRLAEYLLSLNHDAQSATPIEIHGVIHRHDWRIQHIRTKLHLHQGDLRNPVWIGELLQKIQPTHILHLAAWSDVGGSWRNPWNAYELNIQGQLNLLEAICRWQSSIEGRDKDSQGKGSQGKGSQGKDSQGKDEQPCRTLTVSSNEVYGLVRPEDIPIDENTPFRPNSPYGVSKVTQDMMALQYWYSHNLPIIRVRSFNHIGPGQSDAFVASAFARQIVEIELGIREPVVYVGNLSAKRDFTDVRDVVRAYWMAVCRGEPGAVYNVGSGQSRPVRWLLDTMLTLTPAQVEVRTDPNRLRPSDTPNSVCDNHRLVTQTGWQPEISLQDSLNDLLESWRTQLKESR